MKLILILLLLINTTTFSYSQRVWNFTFKDIDNNLQSFEELKGEELTLIDFWTTWCKPCKKSIPKMNEIYQEYKDEGVQVIGINCDGPRSVAKVTPFAHSMNIQYPVLIDINMELMNSLNLANFPTLIMVDPGGEVQYIHEGWVVGDEEEIRKKVKELLTN